MKRSSKRKLENGQGAGVTALLPVRGLPSDVVYHLGTVLPPADAAAFALSSKAILGILGSTVLKLEQKKDRLDLLKRLEIYFPKHILCHECAVFHIRPSLRGKRGFFGWILRKGYQPKRPCEENFYKVAGQIDFHLTFAQVQEVMNRHRFGKQYGVPPSALERHSRGKGQGFYDIFRHRLKYTVLKSISAKIVDGELYVKLDVTYSTSVGLLELPEKLTNSCRNILSCPEQYVSEASTFNQYPHTHRRCNRCQSEWRFSTGNQWIRGGFGLQPGRGFVRITRWHNLGRCHDPEDPTWRLANICSAANAGGPRPWTMYGGSDPIVSRDQSLYMRYFDDKLTHGRVWQRVHLYLDMLRYS